jgi:signal transduction histidine kinase/ligand-binding sensor domain-containing protein
MWNIHPSLIRHGCTGFSSRMTAVLLSFLLFLALFPVQAAKNFSPDMSDPILETWRWRGFPELNEKGLLCMTEGHNRNMWFGTENGAIRFDGLEWTSFQPSQGLVGQRVQALCPGPGKILYAGTNKAICKFDGEHWSRLFPPANTPLHYSWSTDDLMLDSSGTLWATSWWGALRISGENLLLLTTRRNAKHFKKAIPQAAIRIIPDSITKKLLPFGHMQSRFPVYSMLEDANGRFWFGLRPGQMLRFSGNIIQDWAQEENWLLFDETHGYQIGVEPTLIQSQDGKIWMASRSLTVGVQYCQNDNWHEESLVELGGNDIHISLIETTDGTIWAAGMALQARKDGHWIAYSPRQVAYPTPKTLLFESSDGALWVGARAQEVYRVDYATSRWRTYNNLNYQGETPYGDKWFLSQDGRAVYQSGTHWISYGPEDGLMSAPTGLFVSKSGQLWAVGSHEGTAATAKFNTNKQQWTLQTHPKLSWGIDARAVFQDAQGDIWFGASVDFEKQIGHVGGVLRFTPAELSTDGKQRWRHYPSTIAAPFVYGIGQSADGRLWFGGVDLYTYDDGKWSLFIEDTLDKPSILCDAIYSTAKGELWIGSRQYGVYHYDGSHWKRYSERNGIVDNTVISILQAFDGSLWVATAEGISRYDGRSWIKHALPRKFRFYDRRGSLLQSHDGAIWINMRSWAWTRRASRFISQAQMTETEYRTIRYEPDAIAPNTRIVSFPESVPHPGNALVSWKGLDAWRSTPDNELQFSYRLNDEPWSSFKSNTEKILLALPSGNHLFQVRARDRDFNVDPTPASISFEVLPPLWQQSWFLTALAILVGAVLIQTGRVLVRDRNLRSAITALSSANARLEKEILDHRRARSELAQYHDHLEELVDKRTKALEAAQEELLHKERLATLGQLIATVSHELRNPLGTLRTTFFSIAEKVRGRGMAVERALDRAERNIIRCDRIIEELLDYTRNRQPCLEQINVDSWLREWLEEFSVPKGIAIETDLRFGSMLFVDPERFRRCVTNVVQNACQAMNGNTSSPSGITPEEPKRLSISTAAPDGRFELRVSDQGDGIQPEILEKIFEPLFSTKSFGVGLGLPIVNQIMEQHGGGVKIQSQPGRGTTVILWLPLQDKESNQ